MINLILFLLKPKLGIIPEWCLANLGFFDPHSYALCTFTKSLPPMMSLKDIPLRTIHKWRHTDLDILDPPLSQYALTPSPPCVTSFTKCPLTCEACALSFWSSLRRGRRWGRGRSPDSCKSVHPFETICHMLTGDRSTGIAETTH